MALENFARNWEKKFRPSPTVKKKNIFNKISQLRLVFS